MRNSRTDLNNSAATEPKALDMEASVDMVIALQIDLTLMEVDMVAIATPLLLTHPVAFLVQLLLQPLVQAVQPRVLITQLNTPSIIKQLQVVKIRTQLMEVMRRTFNITNNTWQQQPPQHNNNLLLVPAQLPLLHQTNSPHHHLQDLLQERADIML
jgi:hypothetical protein